MRSAFFAILHRDVRLAIGQDGSLAIAMVFLLLVVALLPFGVGSDLHLLKRLAPGLLWIGMLLATLLTLDRLFAADYEDGSLDLLLLTSLPLELVVIAKVFAHWLTINLPLSLAAPLFGVLLNIELVAIVPLLATLLIGSLALSFIGTIGAALTLMLKRGGLLTVILVLPFYVPILIFGVSSVDAALAGTLPFSIPFTILIALTLSAGSLTPFAAAAALRSSMR